VTNSRVIDPSEASSRARLGNSVDIGYLGTIKFDQVRLGSDGFIKLVFT